MISLASLAVFSGLSLNLLLQFALGMSGIFRDSYSKDASVSADREVPFFQLGLIFISVLFLWVFFSFIVPPFWNLFSMYFLFFPISALVCIGLERLAKALFLRVLPKYADIKTVFSSLTAYDGLVPVALIITITLARNFGDAVVLALFFPLGNLAAMFVLNGIHRKSSLEWVPGYIRGTPLILVSMGLLSLISATVAVILFRILEVF